MDEETAKEMRSRANELLLRQEWAESALLYTDFISYCETFIASPNPSETLRKHFCLALAHRAEACIRLRDFANAVRDIERALEIDPEHPRSLFCKGRILVELCQYSQATDCFKRALQQQPTTLDFVDALEWSRKLDLQSKTGNYDLSEWASSGFTGWAPECAEYVGPVEMRISKVGSHERGIFVTRDVDAGTLLIVSKPLAIARGISTGGFTKKAHMAIWKDFASEIQKCAKISARDLQRLYSLCDSDDEGRKRELGIPDMELFKPNCGHGFQEADVESIDLDRILRIAEINALTERGCGVKKLGDYLYGLGGNDCIGLWVLPSFVNHSCHPSAARVHVGDAMFVHAARELKAGDEITFAYFDVLLPLGLRKELCKPWSFSCRCQRCLLENSLSEHLKEIENEFLRIRKSGEDSALTKLAYSLEQKLDKLHRQRYIRPRDRQLIRASFATAYWPMFRSSVLLKRWGRQMPGIETIIDAVTHVLPGDETALCAAASLVDKFKSDRGTAQQYKESMVRALKILKGLYGKQMKSHVMKDLIDAHVHNGGIIRLNL